MAGKGEARMLAALLAGVMVVVAMFAMFRSFGPGDGGVRAPRSQRGAPGEVEPAPPVPGPVESATRRPEAGTQPPAVPLSARPLARAVLRCLDAENGAPLARIQVFDQASNRVIAAADAQGRVELRDVTPGALILFGDDCLAALLPDDARTELRRDGEADVPLWRDRYTLEVTVETRWPAGSAPGPNANLELWLLPADGAPEAAALPAARLGPGASLTPDQRRAFEQHRLLVTQVPMPGLAWHLERQLLPHRLRAEGGRLRLVEARRYAARASAPGGMVARAEIQVRVHGPNVLRLAFEPGHVLDVRVLGATRQPLAEARVVLRQAELPAEQARIVVTGADGIARFDGLRPGERLTGEVTAAMHEPGRFDFALSGGAHDVVMRERPGRLHTITVREAGSLRPLAGVAVQVGDAGRPAAQTSTDARGQAGLRLEPDEVRILGLSKAGYLDYREVLEESLTGGALPQSFELVPSDRQRQLELKLVALVEGELRDAKGEPLPYQTVALAPWVDAQGRPGSDSLPPPGMRPLAVTGPMRTIVAGQTPEPQVTATTDEAGRFQLYSTAAGRAFASWLTPQGEVRREVFLTLGGRQQVKFR